MSGYAKLDSTEHGKAKSTLCDFEDCALDESESRSSHMQHTDPSSSSSSVSLTNSLAKHDEEHELTIDESASAFKKLLVLMSQAFPIIMSFFLGLGGSFISLYFAGRYKNPDGSGSDSVVFAGISLANMFSNVSCLSLLVGMSGAVETLGSQFNGAKDYKNVGIVLQRSILILSLMVIPILFVWAFVESIFLSLGLDAEVCKVIQKYLSIRALNIPADIVNESYEKYLMSIGVVNPSLYMSLTFNLLLLACDYYFVVVLGLGYEYLAVGYVIATYTSGVVQFVFSLRYEEVQRTLQPLSSEAFKDWYGFCVLGVPGTVMLCSEWWAFELLTMMAAMLGTEQVAAQAIGLQVASLAFMVPLGLGIATCSIVGNAIGAGKRGLAIDISHLAIWLILSLEIGVGLTVRFGGKYWMEMFTSNADVLYHADRMLPFLSFFTVMDGVQGVCSGILRGTGNQKLGAYANLFAFYALGLPCAWLFCFKLRWGVNGLLMGISFGTVFQSSFLLFMIIFREGSIFSQTIKSIAVIESPLHLIGGEMPQFQDDGIEMIVQQQKRISVSSVVTVEQQEQV